MADLQRRSLRAAAALLWAGLIFLTSAQPAQPARFWWLDLPFVDKVVHAVVFGVLGALLHLATAKPWLSIFLTSLYGVTDEWHQMSTVGREADPWDWVADTVGAILAVGILTRNRIPHGERVQ